MNTVKVFETPDMPDDLHEIIHELHGGMHQSTYIWWTINDTVDPDEATQQIDAWLIANGANAATDPDDEGELVLLLHWW